MLYVILTVHKIVGWMFTPTMIPLMTAQVIPNRELKIMHI